jgi:hypothetical protein
MYVVLEVGEADSAAVDELPKGAYHVVSDRRLSGGIEAAQFLVTVTAATAPILARVIIEQIRSRKHVRLVKDGVEVSGVSEQTILAILNKIAENPNDSP